MSISKFCLFLISILLLASCQSDPSLNKSTDVPKAKKEKVVKKSPKTAQPNNKVESTNTKVNSTSYSEIEKNTKIDYKRINLNLLEVLVHDEINKARRAHQLQPLSNDLTLRKAAEDQNNYCVRNTELTHTQLSSNKRTIKDRVEFYGKGYTVMAENLIYEGFTVRRTNGEISDIITTSYQELAKTMVINWMKSPGHRANIVEKDLKQVGTAVAYNPKNYAVYATQVFGAK